MESDMEDRLRRYFVIQRNQWNAADEIERLRAERDEARQRTNSILTEIDCRIEHGAESNGHLEVLYDMFKET